MAELYRSFGLQTESLIVDNTAMQMVSRPQQFDVVVAPNLYGNVVANIGAGLIGGAGFVPGYNVGSEFAIYEPGCRHPAKRIQGKDLANPACMLFSACQMLHHLGLETHASTIESTVMEVFRTNPKFQSEEHFSTNLFNQELKRLVISGQK